jgi:hypothetical protein
MACVASAAGLSPLFLRERLARLRGWDAQWVAASAAADGIDLTSTRSAGAQVMIAKQSLLVCRTAFIGTGPHTRQGHRTARHKIGAHRLLQVRRRITG